MSAREDILATVRVALGRDASTPAPAPPPVWVDASSAPEHEILQRFVDNAVALGVSAQVVASAGEALEAAATLIGDRSAVASRAPVIQALGVLGLPSVRQAPADEAELKQACARTQIGVTSCAFALAETGSLVLLSNADEPRMISLLPPAHLAILPRELVLSGMEELLVRLPDPAASSSSMVFITGPSRTADIEQILVKGVHGPAELAVILF